MLLDIIIHFMVITYGRLRKRKALSSSRKSVIILHLWGTDRYFHLVFSLLYQKHLVWHGFGSRQGILSFFSVVCFHLAEQDAVVVQRLAGVLAELSSHSSKDFFETRIAFPMRTILNSSCLTSWYAVVRPMLSMAAICSTVYVRGSGSDFFSFLSIVTSMYLPWHFD